MQIHLNCFLPLWTRQQGVRDLCAALHPLGTTPRPMVTFITFQCLAATSVKTTAPSSSPCRSLLAERFSHCSSCPAHSPELKQCVITHILELDPVDAKIPPHEQLQHGDDDIECFPLDLTAIKMSLILNHDTLWRIYKWDDTGLWPAALGFALKLSRVGNRVEKTPS